MPVKSDKQRKYFLAILLSKKFAKKEQVPQKADAEILTKDKK